MSRFLSISHICLIFPIFWATLARRQFSLFLCLSFGKNVWQGTQLRRTHIRVVSIFLMCKRSNTICILNPKIHKGCKRCLWWNSKEYRDHRPDFDYVLINVLFGQTYFVHCTVNDTSPPILETSKNDRRTKPKMMQYVISYFSWQPLWFETAEL